MINESISSSKIFIVSISFKMTTLHVNFVVDKQTDGLS
jgi:hypothetical protein